VQDMIAIRKKREGLKSVASAVIFIEVANNSDALIGKFLQVKNEKIYIYIIDEVILEAIES
jgi:hypothetical protein